ncbi:hypothetical protein GCM10010428_80910 [Actinosynnema pretiosum subsp. pretiosum]
MVQDNELRPGSPLRRAALFAALYAAASALGGLVVADGTVLNQIWPASGVLAVWFCLQRDSHRWLDLTAFTAVTLAFTTPVAGLPIALVCLISTAAQSELFTRLLSHLRPDLWGAGGTRPFGRTSDLGALLTAAVLSTTTGAVLCVLGVRLAGGDPTWSEALVWTARNTASILLVGTAGLCVSRARAANRVTPRRPRLNPASLLEGTAVVLGSATAYLVAFVYNHGLPLAFPLLLVTVWAALRMPTTFVALHDLALGGAAVLFTLHGHGPFASITSPVARVLVVQVFILMVAVVGLTLALGRDERAALLDELAEGRRDASNQAGLLAAIIDSMADGLVVVDREGNAKLRNPAAQRLMGDADTAVLTRPDGTPLAAADLPHAVALSGRRQSHGEDLLLHTTTTPETRVARVTATALPDNEAAVVLFHDVTAERRHRDELANFAGSVAHDLLTPLTTAHGWTDLTASLIEDHPTHPAAPALADAIERVARANTRMSTLITDLLAYTTARDAAVNPVAIDLGALVAEVAAARADAATATGATPPSFHISELLPVRADPVLLRQLIDNLLGNAIKYTAEGVPPRITIDSHADRAGAVHVDVVDNGIGIPPGQHGAIFDNFHRAHRASGRLGTGLGLAICKRIVERHGGEITAQDNPGGGSRFSFTLPAVG